MTVETLTPPTERATAGRRRPSTAGAATAELRIKPRHRGLKRLSNIAVVAMLALAVAAILLYISNIIAVNELAVRTEELRRELRTVRYFNEGLEAERDLLISRDRITEIGEGQLGLRAIPQGTVRLDIAAPTLATAEQADADLLREQIAQAAQLAEAARRQAEALAAQAPTATPSPEAKPRRASVPSSSSRSTRRDHADRR